MLKRGGEGQELTKGVPSQMSLLGELLNVLGRRSTCTGLEQTPAIHQRDDGEHLGACPHLQDRKEVRQVITKDVAGDRYGLLPLHDPLTGETGRIHRGHDPEVQSLRIMVLQVEVYLFQELCVVCPLLVQPENTGRTRRPCPGHGELHPVLDGEVLDLTHTEDIALFHIQPKERPSGCGYHPNHSVPRTEERLVVGAVLLRLLGHEADVWNGTHRGGVKRPVLLAELYGGLIDTSIAVVGDHELGIVKLSVPAPHPARIPYRRWHGCVYDNVAWNVQICYTLVGVDHGKLRPLLVDGLNIRLYLRPLHVRQGADLGIEVAQSVVRGNAQLRKKFSVLFEYVAEENGDHVAEDYRVGHLHHGGLQVHGEEDPLRPGILDLLLYERPQGQSAHLRDVYYLTVDQRRPLLQDLDLPIRVNELDPAIPCGGLVDGGGDLVGE